AGISRVHLPGRLWRVCSGLHRGRDVPHSRTPTQNAPVAFDFLSSAAVDLSLRRDHAIALVGICSLYPRIDQWIFCRRTAAVDPNDLRDRGVGSLRINFTRPISALVRAETGGGALHHWFYRCVDFSLGNHVDLPNVYTMNLFSVGILHNHVNIESLAVYA